MAEPSVPTRTKVFFGIGSMAESVFLYSFGFFSMLYYNQVLGLPATLAGLGPTLALVFDAVTDPLMGSWSDRFKSKKWGRRHPFMLAAPIPVTLCFLAIFNPPSEISQTGLFIWLVVFSILMRSSMTLFFIPHMAFGAELSKDYHERSSVMSYGSSFGFIGASGTQWLSLSFVFMATADYANGLLNPNAYPIFSWWVAAIVFVSLYLSAWFTRDRIPTLHQPDSKLPSFSIKNLFSDLFNVLRNRNYLCTLLGLLFLSLTIGMRATFSQYMNIFYWELLPVQIRWFVIGGIIGHVLGFLLAYRLHKRFDKRPVMVLTVIGYGIFEAMPVILRILGVFPENGTDALFPSILVFHALGSVSVSIYSISIMSALADVADENESRHGLRQEGMIYSARTFFSKVDRAIGTLIAGVSLDLILFPPKAKPGEVPEDVIFMLGVIDSPVTIIPALIAAVFLAGYGIDKKSHAQIKSRLSG